MATQIRMANARTSSSVNLLAGIWLVLAPFILGYAAVRAAQTNDIVLGIIVAVLAIIELSMPDVSWARWANIIAGIWLVIAPFVLYYSSATSAMWNDIVLGIIVVVMAAWGVSSIPQQGPRAV